MTYRILHAVTLTLHDGGDSIVIDTKIFSKASGDGGCILIVVNPLSSWKEPQDGCSVTLLVFPEKSLDTVSTVRRPYTVQPLLMPPTLAVMISGGQDEVGII